MIALAIAIGGLVACDSGVSPSPVEAPVAVTADAPTAAPAPEAAPATPATPEPPPLPVCGGRYEAHALNFHNGGTVATGGKLKVRYDKVNITSDSPVHFAAFDTDHGNLKPGDQILFAGPKVKTFDNQPSIWLTLNLPDDNTCRHLQVDAGCGADAPAGAKYEGGSDFNKAWSVQTDKCVTPRPTPKPTPPPDPECDLTISKSFDPGSSRYGRTVKVVLGLKNEGDSKCTGGGVKLQDNPPSGLDYVPFSESHSSNGSYSYGSCLSNCRWNFGTLDPGETASASFKLKVKTRCKKLVNTAHAWSAEKGWIHASDTLYVSCGQD